MKRSAILLLLVFLGSGISSSQSSWIEKPTGTTKTLYDVQFRTAREGWAVGSQGTIARTTDAGETWTIDSVEYLTVKPLLGFVEVQDSLNIWAGWWASPTFRSTDAGSNWEVVLVDSFANPRIFFVNPSLGFAASAELGGQYRGRVLRTTNGGIDWAVIHEQNYRQFNDLFFVDSLFGVVVGGRGVAFDNFDPETIQRTTDGGITWDEIDAPGEGPLSAVVFRDKFKGWACGANGRTLRTTDGGLSWEHPPSQTFGSWTIALPSANDVWIVDYSRQTIHHSTDDGQTWTPHPLPTGRQVFGLSFLTPMIGWAAGDSGSVWKYDLATGIEREHQERASEFLTCDGFPNPFNASVTIRFSLPSASWVSLELFDILGRRIVTLADSWFPAGNYSRNFDAVSLPSGIYILTLRAGDHRLIRKLIMAK